MSGGSLAGVFGMVQMYKQAKIDSDYKLMNMSMELVDAAHDKEAVCNLFANRRSEIDTENARQKSEGRTEEGSSEVKYDARFVNYQLEDGEVLSGDFTYEQVLKKLDKMESDANAHIAAEEQEWQTKFQKEQLNNSMLQSNIENYESMLQNNIEGNFSYGYSN